MAERMVNRVTNIMSNCLRKIIVVFVFFNFIYSEVNKNGIIYIGEWTQPGLKAGYPDLKIGQHAFITRNCSFVNCFYTTEHYYLNDIKNYDVLVFNAKTLHDLRLPNRTVDQQFIFLSFEPGPIYMTSELKYSFDLTFTYKLSSDIVRPFFIVKNNRNEVIGPQRHMQWETKVNDMKPISNEIKSKLQNKRIAAAIVTSQCDFHTKPSAFVQKLQTYLSKYGQYVDIYGCNQTQCQMNIDAENYDNLCSTIIKKEYYFYLAFEDVSAEDYVTDKVLFALNNYAVPVVYGGANYSRFMPNGIYINGRFLGVRKLSKLMMDAINDNQTYYNYFKWHEYYSFHGIDVDSERYDGICDLCAFANNKTRRPLKQLMKF